MQIENSFTIPVGVDEAWKVLLDIERIVPCMPGAGLDSVDGDDFTGTVKVKVGPIALTYRGSAAFVEKDQAAHRAVIDAKGRDTRGNGTANAKITATLHDKGANTDVTVVTDLDITGKPAQFGRGVIVDVGNKLLGQFATCLADKLADRGEQAAPAASAAGAPAAPTATAAPATSATSATSSASAAKPAAAAGPEPINLLESAGPAVLKRLAPVVGLLVAVFVLYRLRRKPTA